MIPAPIPIAGKKAKHSYNGVGRYEIDLTLPLSKNQRTPSASPTLASSSTSTTTPFSLSQAAHASSRPDLLQIANFGLHQH